MLGVFVGNFVGEIVGALKAQKIFHTVNYGQTACFFTLNVLMKFTHGVCWKYLKIQIGNTWWVIGLEKLLVS